MNGTVFLRRFRHTPGIAVALCAGWVALCCALSHPMLLAGSTDQHQETSKVILAARRFLDLDTNNDFRLDAREGAAIKGSKRKSIFEEFDQNQDSVVTRVEFLNVIQEKIFSPGLIVSRLMSSLQDRFSLSHLSALSAAKMSAVAGKSLGTKLYKQFDINGDGRLSDSEAVLMEIFLITLLRGQEFSDNVASTLSQKNVPLEISQARKILHLLLDSNADGNIAEGEFGTLTPEAKQALVHELSSAASVERPTNPPLVKTTPPLVSKTSSEATSAATSSSRVNSPPSSVATTQNSGTPQPARTGIRKMEFLFSAPPKKPAPVNQPAKTDWRYSTEKILW